MNGFSYVYILQSEVQSSRHYTGLTQDLRRRRKTHNAGHLPHTTRAKSWPLTHSSAQSEGSIPFTGLML